MLARVAETKCPPNANNDIRLLEISYLINASVN